MGRTWKFEELEQMSLQQLQQYNLKYAIKSGAYTGKSTKKHEHQHCATCQESLFGVVIIAKEMKNKRLRDSIMELLEMLYINGCHSAIEILYFENHILKDLGKWRKQNGN